MLALCRVANCKSVTLIPSKWAVLTIIVLRYIPDVHSNKELL